MVPRGETDACPASDSLPVAGEQRIASTRTVRLGSVRGTGGVPDVSVPLTDAPSELVIEPDVVVLTCADGAIELECAGGSAPADAAVRRVRDGPGQTPWRRRSRGVRRARCRWRRTQLSFTLREPGSLDAGDYDLIVRGHSPDHEEVVARFWLRVSAQ